MNLKTIFKRLVLTDLALSILIIVMAFYTSEQVENFNDNYSKVSEAMAIIYLIILVVWLVNFYFLYNFKKIGKQIFIFLFVITLILILPTGSIAVDSTYYVLDYLGAALNGAMLVFLYFTPIKKEFDK